MTNKYRIEQDSLGQVQVNEQYYWGAQTQRSLENFNIGAEKMPPALIHALVLLKKIAAKVNLKLGLLEQNIAKEIITAVDKILAGKFLDNFPLVVWQTGSGTQTNMNVNEVIANIANENLGESKGSKYPVHPNDHVNMCQSSNDSFPTAMHIAATIEVKNKLLPNLLKLHETLERKTEIWKSIIKIGRTHLQDATPITLGQEFSAYAEQIYAAINRLQSSLQYISHIPQGGTAVGTGINCHADFSVEFAKILTEETKHQFYPAKNKFAGIAAHDSLVSLSADLNSLAVSLLKIVNDIRLLSSGPRCGIAELKLPENEPGSSIMPGKINPTQCEALSMVCYQVMGNNLAVSLGGASGHLELNAFKPLIIYNLLQSINLLSSGINNFNEKCLIGIEPDLDRISYYTSRSLMLVTALVPYIGYDKSAKIVQKAIKDNQTLKEAAIELEFLSEEEFNKIIKLENMV